MRSSKYQMRKLDRKQRRCEIIIQNEMHIKSATNVPTAYLAILNAGLSNGLTEETVLLSVEKFGKICKLLMIPNKSYCFLQCPTKEDARNIYEGMHGKATIGQNNASIYLSYFDALPDVQTMIAIDKQFSTSVLLYPSGLYVLKDFVTEDEEKQLLKAVNMDCTATDDCKFSNDHDDGNNNSNIGYKLKYRKVKHFGYEFSYEKNNVDVSQPLLDRKIPEECRTIWSKLENWKDIQENGNWQAPDQLTVNLYEPGQGIPLHVDTHSAFVEPILSLSLKSDITMEFRRGTQKFSVYLPQRSLLIMSGEARYDWMHGITPRMYDVITTPSGNLSTQRRQRRVSLTFRTVRRSKVCNCKYPMLCDSKRSNQPKPEEQVQTTVPLSLEDSNVHQIYDHIAEHFSQTRHTPWPKVKQFLQNFPIGSIILDVGCGNGKYLYGNSNLFNIGCDRSSNLLKLCRQNVSRNECFRCDCLSIPVRTACLDGCICIAVIHHLSTYDRRLQSLKELVRVLKSGGRALVYVWAKNQKVNNLESNYLKNKHKLPQQQTRGDLISETSQVQQYEAGQQKQLEQRIGSITLPVHVNRTEFMQQDVLVPWKMKTKSKDNGANNDNTTFLRYYHVFEENELVGMLEEIPDIRILSNYYDQGNYCCIFEKI